MCAITGVVSLKNQIQIKKIIEKMLQVQIHRGPDDSGCLFYSNLALGHQRLSIIDLSAAGHQPMETEDKNYAIVYNGEVYNFKELRQELKKNGFPFFSQTDGEIVLKLYSRGGLKMLPRLNGMFAFAILDKKEQKLILSRDRLGIKPLHYLLTPSGFLFSSEIKGILSVYSDFVGHDPEINQNTLNDIILTGHIEDTETMFQNIKTLSPGSYLIYDLKSNQITTNFYYRITDQISENKFLNNLRQSEKYLTSHLESLLIKSVESHLISDAPIGVLCSGGIDSSLITTLACRNRSNLQIFHARAENFNPEEKFARKIADHFKIKIHYAEMDQGKYLNLLPEIIYQNEMPIYHPNDISLYSVCELARQNGIKVLLAGEGGDELFGGYTWHQHFYTQLKQRAILDWFGSEFKKIYKELLKRTDGFLFYPELNLSEYISFAGIDAGYSKENIERLQRSVSLILSKGERLNRWQEILSKLSFIKNNTERATTAFILDNLIGHLGTILYRTDRMGMLASIESRVPYLENEIIDFAINLPLKLKIRQGQGKWILKKVAERYLPKSIVYRKKMGFPVPWPKYISYNENLFKNGFVCHLLNLTESALKNWIGSNLYFLFRIINLELWGRIFINQENRENLKQILLKK